MSGTTHQTSLDNAHHTACETSDPVLAEVAERETILLRDSYGLEVYCPQHRNNHLLSAREVEQLVYGLLGHLADMSADSDIVRPDYPDQVVEVFCPAQNLRDYLSGEMYDEHISSLLDARQGSELRAVAPS